jgi:outer membrane protein OmpA-like peptidoglycan-associated protein
MKKLFFLLIAGHASLSAVGQNNAPKPYTTDKDLSRWVLDVNLLGGTFNQKMDMATTGPNYLNGINVNTGGVGFKSGGTVGGDLQLGYFFDKNRHWGIGTGLLYLREWGNVTLDNFHAEYQSVDNNGYIFRQVVSANPIKEEVRIDNFNIPLVLKYKNRFSKHWGFTADAGVLFNVKAKNTYTTNASFDYEAIYKFVTTEGNVSTPVYETSVIPADNDFLITKAHFSKNNPGSVQEYFNTKRSEGYNVGLGVTPDQQKGTVSYATGSVGFMLQPSVNYFFSDRVALNVGAYYIYQEFKNEGTKSYTLTGKPGEYSSVLNSVSKVQTQSFGGNLGLRFFLGGKKAAPMNISNTDQYDPTGCAACDGSFALHGLKAGERATVTYSKNGATPANIYPVTVSNDGTVTVPNLCAGSYTDIKATIGKQTAASKSVNLVAPNLVIDRVESENPSAPGKCDGSITLYGLQAGQKAKVSYAMNGTKRSASYTVAADNSLRLPGLCEGTVTGISVESNKCTADLSNRESIVLAGPKPAAPVAQVPVTEAEDPSTQILFDFNTANLRSTSYAVIDKVYDQMQEDRTSTVVIEGNTDQVGTDEYNQKLSNRRAAAVQAYLIKRGIASSRIMDQGNGEREPVATNNTAEGRSKNRRAEIVLRIK